MITRFCAALLVGALSVGPASRTNAALETRSLYIEPAPACVEEFRRLNPLRPESAQDGQQTLGPRYVARMMSEYSAHYRATLPTGRLGRQADPSRETQLGQSDRTMLSFLAMMLRTFEMKYENLERANYALCLRRQILKEVELLPGGGNYDPSPAWVYKRFQPFVPVTMK